MIINVVRGLKLPKMPVSVKIAGLVIKMKSTDTCKRCGHIRRWHCSPIKADKGCIVIDRRNNKNSISGGKPCHCDYFILDKSK